MSPLVLITFACVHTSKDFDVTNTDRFTNAHADGTWSKNTLICSKSSNIAELSHTRNETKRVWFELYSLPQGD